MGNSKSASANKCLFTKKCMSDFYLFKLLSGMFGSFTLKMIFRDSNWQISRNSSNDSTENTIELYYCNTFKLTINIRTLPIFFNLHLPITSLILWNQLNFDLLAYFLKWVSVFDLRFGHWDYSLKQLVNLHHLCPIYWRHKSGTLYYCILNFSTLFSVIMEILIFWKHLTKPFVCCYWQN